MAAASLLLTLLVPLITDTVAMRLQPDLAASRFDVVRGAQIFTSRCAVCHAEQADDLSRLGPNLHALGAEASTRKQGLNGPEYILESIMQPGIFMAPTATAALMPQNLVADLSDEDIRDLVAHVQSLGARPKDDQIAALVIERETGADDRVLEIRREVIELGERVYREKCHACHGMHNLNEYTVLAPVVFGVGVPQGDALVDAIMHRRIPVSERYRSSRVKLTNGTTLTGILLEGPTDELLILSSAREHRGRVVRVKLEDVRKDANGEPMIVDIGLPPILDDVVSSLTPEEVDALAVLLQALN